MQEELAMKVVSKRDVAEKQMSDYVLAERRIASSIHHPYVVPLHSAFQTPKHLVFVMQHCPGGSLSGLFKRQGSFSVELSRHYTSQVLLALEHLHERNIVHRDVKSDNILIDQDGHAMLSDFGCSRYMGVDLAQTFCGSDGYVAPEVLERSGYDDHADVYSLGVVLFEMLVGQLPFYHRHRATCFKLIKTATLQIPSRVPSAAADCIRTMMSRDLDERPSAGGMQAHTFFSEIDFVALLKRLVPVPETLDIERVEAGSPKAALKQAAFGRRSFLDGLSQCLPQNRPLQGFDCAVDNINKSSMVRDTCTSTICGASDVSSITELSGSVLMASDKMFARIAVGCARL